MEEYLTKTFKLLTLVSLVYTYYAFFGSIFTQTPFRTWFPMTKKTKEKYEKREKGLVIK